MSAENTRQFDLLVVDDDPRNVKLLEGYLQNAGYRVRCANDGPTALALAQELVPDLVLLDVMMSGMNGLEVCRELKANPRTRLSQVMLVTALGDEPHHILGLDHGADDYVAKPVRRNSFLAKVRSLLRVRGLLLELEDARSQLAERNGELEELQALKETLSQTLVHDLKNPLTAVVGSLDLLERRVDEVNQPLVSRCRTSASRIQHMIMDLLDIAGLEHGRLTLHRENVDALELLQKAIDDVEYAAQSRKVQVEITPPEDDCSLEGDSSVLRRVMDNLLTNAVEHSPSEGVVTVSLGMREEGIEVSVADEGPGIPEEHREQVFEKFARLNLRESGVSANRGLGLTFCRLAVEAHGGVIWVETAPSGGAMFRALLPASEAVEAAESAEAAR
ncbi:hypothetical protein ABI59_04550 [Acidobacteria bacterium Mor1]|nr:hypothetical protein ABI59_04550 [Acidobacteria bacterium Mor1]